MKVQTKSLSLVCVFAVMALFFLAGCSKSKQEFDKPVAQDVIDVLKRHFYLADVLELVKTCDNKSQADDFFAARRDTFMPSGSAVVDKTLVEDYQPAKTTAMIAMSVAYMGKEQKLDSIVLAVHPKNEPYALRLTSFAYKTVNAQVSGGFKESKLHQMGVIDVPESNKSLRMTIRQDVTDRNSYFTFSFDVLEQS